MMTSSRGGGGGATFGGIGTVLRRHFNVWVRRQELTIYLIAISILAVCQVYFSRSLLAARVVVVSGGGPVVVSTVSTVPQSRQTNAVPTPTPTIPPSLPPPLLLLKKYIQQHSQTALLDEWQWQRNRRHNSNITTTTTATTSSPRRKYALGYYSCPQQAGNRLHHLFNAFVWGIVLNRTVLVQYYTKEVCQIVGTGYDPGICLSANQQEDCNLVLRRHDWVPLFADWKDRLGLPDLSRRRLQQSSKHNETSGSGDSDTTILQLNFWSTRGPAGTSTRRPWHAEFEAFLHVDLLDGGEGVEDGVRDAARIIDFPQMLSQDAKLLTRGSKDKNLNKLLATSQARDRARSLMAMGRDYLYGMLFRHLFDFQPTVVPSSIHDIPDNALVIGLHSRHISDTDNGSNVSAEIYCMDQVFLQLQQQEETKKGGNARPCVLLLMSDRTKTLALLTEHAKTRNCTARTAPKTKNPSTSNKAQSSSLSSSSWRMEHGPYSGIGFYQDLAFLTMSSSLSSPPYDNGSALPVVQQRRPRMDAFIGSGRSSSLLIQELIAYDRYASHHQQYYYHQQQQRSKNDAATSPLITCQLPD